MFLCRLHSEIAWGPCPTPSPHSWPLEISAALRRDQAKICSSVARAFLCAPQQGAKRTSTPTSVRGWLANWLSQANVKKYNVHTHSITFWLSCYGYTMVFRLTLSATPYESCDVLGHSTPRATPEKRAATSAGGQLNCSAGSERVPDSPSKGQSQ